MDTPQWAIDRINKNSNYLDLTYEPYWHKEAYLTEFPNEIFSHPNITMLNLSNNKLKSLPKEINRFKNLVYLSLGNNQLQSLPDTLFDLTNLVYLDLSSNQFQSLPDTLLNLINLKGLNLGGNPDIKLPKGFPALQNLNILNLSATNIHSNLEQIISLTQLKTLSLGGSGLTFLPKEITEIKSLSVLNLISNSLSALPGEIGNLYNLTELNLTNNLIRSFPDSMKNLVNLQKLFLSNNPIKYFPEIITKLKSLKILHIGNSQFAIIPQSLGNLSNLQQLYLANSNIKYLPDSIGNLHKLESLQLRGTNLITPPLEVAQKGIQAIREYFRQLQGGQDQLYEAKLLILGEGGAGKTTLANKILNENYQLHEEISTEGVDVKEWSFPLEDGKQFRVNIWDFGGQEIYHSTHQFFLTKRSLYALVADTRKEDTDFYYWLNAVELLSDGSPLIIIKNEKQNRHREINERQLKGQFENLKDILSTNLATNRGIQDVKNSIKHYINSLPHIGSPLPKTWVMVREKLEKDPRNFISLEEYIKICKRNGFTEVKDSLQLSGYLHDIGVFLHFQDDPLLRKTVILKPKWGTDAVYKVLDNKNVIHNLGQFTRNDIASIWKDNQYNSMHNELLQLMMKFKLCYEIPNKKGIYLAPQLLSENQPQYPWNGEENLLLRYSYEFMPKGILTQVIVSMNQYILNLKGESFVWKSGLLIAKDNTVGEVIELYGKRQIQIRISGAHKRELLTIIMYQIDQIHSSYNRLQFDKLIPCNCIDCQKDKEPYFYRFDQLQSFIEKKIAQIQCGKSGIMVFVRYLIDDVISEMYLQKIRENDSTPNINISLGDYSNIGNLVLDNSTQNNLKKVSSANIPSNLKETLEQLILAVNVMNTSSNHEKSTEVATNLENLVIEATKQKPNRNWYSVSIDGLIRAAENLDKLGEPVISLSRKVLSILSGGAIK